jgi:hypothetical protein
MARLKFKRFSDLSFLQGIDKPRYLSPLLIPFADYFERQGVDVSKLANNDPTDRKLLEVFTNPDEEMPGPLLEVLYVLDDLADDSGYERILGEVERSGETIEGLNSEMTPGEYAIAIFRAKPGLIQACHEKTVYRKIRSYMEFQSIDNSRLTLAAAKKTKAMLEQRLAEWFDTRNRGRVCDIYAYEEGPEIRFVITHGKTYRSEGSIDKKLRKSRIAYRPQRHDSVIYDTRTGILKVSAQTRPEKEEYRRQFGQAFFGNTEHFPEGDIYTLFPMKGADFRIRVPNGIDWASLCEVWVSIEDDQSILQITKGYDLLKPAKEKVRLNFEEGEIKRAVFKVKYASGGKPRNLEIRPPNIAIYDRDRDGAAAEAFLDVNKFLKIELAWPTPELI